MIVLSSPVLVIIFFHLFFFINVVVINDYHQLSECMCNEQICMILFNLNDDVFLCQALESDLSSRDEKFLNPLLNVEKFRWMTVAAASVGKLPSLINGLVR